MTKLHLDFETASTADLRKIGSAAYARHPDTRVLCMAWAFDHDPVAIWVPGNPFPKRVADHAHDGGTVSGWSLQFEYQIWNQRMVTCWPLSVDQLDDVQARAAYHGLPLSLEDAGAVLRLPIQKDKDGHALMLRMCRPRAVNPTRWWHVEDPQKYLDLQAYCMRDVEAERLIDDRLPALPPVELATWMIDARANAYGITVDKPLARQLHALAKASKKRLDQQLSVLTAGEVPTCTNTGKLLAYVNRMGVGLKDLQKGTVKAYLDAPTLAPAHVRDVLTLRQAAAKTSAAKLPVLLDASPDGIVRGMLAYYGAQRTGRWAGRLLQPQNLPRGILKDKAVQQALGAVQAGAVPEDLELLFGRPGVSALDIVINLIRSCLVARPGHALVVADFSQIEARVIAWLAYQNDILKVFESGEDVYTHTARAIGSQSRQLGKVLVLACGFGQGHVKFQETARGYGLDLTLAQCKDAVDAWRQANHKIVDLWGTYDRLAKNVAISGGALLTAGHVGKVGMSKRRKMLVIHLPSGRELFYHNIRLVDGNLTYDGIHQTTKRWEAIKTYGGKLAENITQAVARDIMREAILALPPNLRLLLTIHDELICECALVQPAFSPAIMLDILLARMKTTPPWAAGLPVTAAGWIGDRYRKG